MILTDRVTGLPAELFIADGVYGVASSAETPVAEPVLNDAASGKKFKVFIADGVIGWEETTGTAVASVAITDQSTGIAWLLKIYDGILEYVYSFSLTTARDSRISSTVTDTGKISASFAGAGGISVSETLESRID